MQAIIEVSGRQYHATPGQYIYVPFLEQEPGTELICKEVLLLDKEDGHTPEIGTPYLNSVEVKAEVLEHVKGDKCIVFKKKRRKGYRTKNGHRQTYTKIRIQSIS